MPILGLHAVQEDVYLVPYNSFYLCWRYLFNPRARRPIGSDYESSLNGWPSMKFSAIGMSFSPGDLVSIIVSLLISVFVAGLYAGNPRN